MWYVSLHGGTQGMVKANTYEAASKKARELFGSLAIEWIRKATAAEVEWHEAMNGKIF